MVTQPANCKVGQRCQGGHDTCKLQQTGGALLIVAWGVCWGFQPLGHTTGAGHSRHRMPARAAWMGATTAAGQTLSAHAQLLRGQ